MRIALSGSHPVGKTSLLNELQRQLVGYDAVEEPYAELLLAGETREWISAAHGTLSTIDLIVYVPIEQPDRISTGLEFARQRSHVDGLLREMLMDDGYGFSRPAIEVHGSVEARAHRVTSALDGRDPTFTSTRVIR